MLFSTFARLGMVYLLFSWISFCHQAFIVSIVWRQDRCIYEAEYPEGFNKGCKKVGDLMTWCWVHGEGIQRVQSDLSLLFGVSSLRWNHFEDHNTRGGSTHIHHRFHPNVKAEMYEEFLKMTLSGAGNFQRCDLTSPCYLLQLFVGFPRKWHDQYGGDLQETWLWSCNRRRLWNHTSNDFNVFLDVNGHGD